MAASAAVAVVAPSSEWPGGRTVLERFQLGVSHSAEWYAPPAANPACDTASVGRTYSPTTAAAVAIRSSARTISRGVTQTRLPPPPLSTYAVAPRLPSSATSRIPMMAHRSEPRPHTLVALASLAARGSLAAASRPVAPPRASPLKLPAAQPSQRPSSSTMRRSVGWAPRGGNKQRPSAACATAVQPYWRGCSRCEARSRWLRPVLPVAPALSSPPLMPPWTRPPTSPRRLP